MYDYRELARRFAELYDTSDTRGEFLEKLIALFNQYPRETSPNEYDALLWYIRGIMDSAEFPKRKG